MRPKGTIYNGKRNRGHLRIALTQKEIKRFKLFRIAGALLASISITSLVYFWGPMLVSDMVLAMNRSSTPVIASTPAASPEPTAQAKVESKIDKQISKDFSISIPVIGANATVSLNIDPYNQDEYLAALKKGVAHAKGTGLPGEGKRIYLFAHSTNSPANFAFINAVFYQLRKLEKGDLITTNYGDKEYRYEVTNSIVVSANDTSWLTADSIGEQLVLQTCDPPGTSFRRLLVFAKPI